jgi:hypothetical protein
MSFITKNISIYHDYEVGIEYLCLRVCSLETPKFPHGVGVGHRIQVNPKNESIAYEKARQLAGAIEEYLIKIYKK